jgi:GST-like protein
MKLYGCKGCGSAAIEALLQMGGIGYDYVEAVQWQPFKHHEDLLRLNPLAQVPTLLLDDGSVMTESAAIMLWLCEKQPSLMPADPAQRAQFYRWMIFLPANLYAVFAFRDFPAKWVDGDDAQAAFRAKTSQRLQDYWLIMERSLRTSPYLLGETMSALDVYVAMMSRWTPGRPWFAENCPALMQAVALTEQHPVVAAVWEKNFGK